MAPVKVMVVEDERIVALHLKQQLSKLGYDVVSVAYSGEQALRLIASAPPDIVLMDIRIDGDLDGIETATRIPSELHLPIIYLTAHAEEDTLARARETRPFGYLLKPFSERDLHAAIQMAVSRVASERSLRESEERLGLALEAAAMRSWELDPASQRILRVGRATPRSGGDALCDVLQEFFDDTWSAFLDRVHTDDRQAVRDLFERAIDDGTTLTGAEFRSPGTDGTIRWFRIQGRRFADTSQGQARIIGVIQDVTARHAAEERLRQAALVLETIQDGILVLDPDLAIRSVNRGYCAMTGYTAEELVGKQPALLSSRAQSNDLYDDFLRRLAETGEWRGEIRGLRKDGGHFPVLLTVAAIRGGDGRPARYVAAFTDLSAVRKAEEELQHLAHYDHLTGLPNRLLGFDRLEHAAQRANRGGCAALLLIDLDDFKRVNDTFGHTVGDEVLRIAARRMREVVREEDTVARLGGDEFLVILERVGEPAEAAVVANRLIEAMVRPMKVVGAELTVAASIGISLCPQDFDTATDLIQASDTAMYAAKASGRRGYAFYTLEMTVSAMRSMAQEQELRRAVDRGELVLHYQPQLALPERRVIGVEALVRWAHPERGLLGADQVIPVAERCGLIQDIGDWVLRRACEQWVEWRNAGAPALRLAVNVSPHQLRNGRFVRTVEQTLAATGIPPACLEMEITETTLQSEEGCVASLLALEERGVRLAIDDFGTGYSNLSSLQRLPIHRLKVDRGFIRDIPARSGDAALAETIIAIAHRLRLQVLAEGIETPAQEAFIVAQGCREVQGFLYARPMPAEEIGALLQHLPDPPTAR